LCPAAAVRYVVSWVEEIIQRVAVARLIYSAICSLDGYVEDAHGRFDWAEPDEEVFSLVNDLERPVGTYLYGRRMYETMLPWETADTSPDQPAVVKDFTRTWQAADKIVFSTTLRSVSSARTRIEHGFQPDAIRRLKTTVDHDITVGGADLAGQAITAGLVDELRLFVVPRRCRRRQASTPRSRSPAAQTAGHAPLCPRGRVPRLRCSALR